MASRKELLEFFNQADEDKSGYLSIKELGNVLKSFGYNLSSSKLDKVFKSMDKAGDNRVSREEFLAAMETNVPKEDHEIATIRRTFQSFDRDGNHHIDRDELRLGMEILGQCLNERDIHAMMAIMDRDSSGMIDYEEFIQMFQQERIK